MKKTIYMICAVLAFAACEMRFELDIPKEESKIFAFCVPGARDSTAILVDLARFTGDSISFDRSKVDIDIRVNGERQEVMFQPEYTFPYDPSDHTVPQESFYITRKLDTGDEVSLTVSYPGLESVSASTVVPERPKDVSFSIETARRDEWATSEATFTLEYSDPSDDTYYAVVFRQKCHEFRVRGYIEEDGQVITDTTEYIDWNTYVIDCEFDPFQSKPEYNFDASNNSTGLIFWKNSDALDNDGKKRIFFTSYTEHDVSYHRNDLNHGYLDISYEVTIYRISEELYRYYQTNMLANENSLSYFGMSRSNITFSNIKGGFGILGGMAGTVLTADVE